MNHILRGRALVAGLAAAAPAAAECFSAADLGRGIDFVYPNGDRTRVRRLNTGYQEVIESYVSGKNPIRLTAHHGIYVVQEFEIDSAGQPVPGTRLDIAFPVDPLTLPRPEAGVVWEGETVNIFEEGGQRGERTSVRFSAAPPVELSGCSYEAIRADLRYDWGSEGGLTLVYLYLPALGTAYVLSNQFDGDAVNEAAPVAIEAATK